MKHPGLREERKLARAGFRRVAGLDEAGRGPLAGPVMAAAVIVKRTNIPNSLKGVKDSKKLSFQKRAELYKSLTNSPLIKWAAGRVSEKVIDKINIFEATKLAMKRAVRNLEKKYSYGRPPASRYRSRRLRAGICIAEGQRPKARFSHADFLILDGNFRLNLPIWQMSIVKADEKVFSCACASIIAKVRRDRIMERYHKKYPNYGFAQHKGYGTKQHLRTLKKYGPCKIHRRSFRPIKLLKIQNSKSK